MIKDLKETLKLYYMKKTLLCISFIFNVLMSYSVESYYFSEDLYVEDFDVEINADDLYLVSEATADELKLTAESFEIQWNDPEYIWTADSCTAVRESISNDPIKQVESVAIEVDTTKQPTFDAVGYVTYTAKFANDAFGTKTKIQKLAKLERKWDFENVKWTWAEDSTSAVIAINSSNSDFVVTAKVNAEHFTAEPTCQTKGYSKYVVNYGYAGSPLRDSLMTEKGLTEDLWFEVPEFFKTCEYTTNVEIEEFSTDIKSFSWKINGLDVEGNDFSMEIPSAAPLSGTIEVTANGGCSTETKEIPYSIQKQLIRVMWDDVISIVDPNKEYSNFRWYRNDKLIGTAPDYMLESGGLSGVYYVIATTAGGEEVRSCELDFEDSSRSTVLVYPNPAADVVSVIGGQWQAGDEIDIFNSNGGLVQQTIAGDDSKVMLDVSTFSRGIYKVKIGKEQFALIKK